MKLKAPKFIKKLGTKKPELLFVAGIGCIVVGTVGMCVAAFKEKDIVEDLQEELEEIKSDDTLTEEETKKQVAQSYIRFGVKTAKNFAIPAITEGLGIACVTKSHRIIKADLIATGAALTRQIQDHQTYRQRVRDIDGIEKDLEYLGYSNQEFEEVYIDKDGLENINHKTGFVGMSEETDIRKFFDASCKGWTKDPEENLAFLKRIQCMCTDKLRADGYLFLNDVYEMLGYQRTRAGQRIGWLADKGPGYVDFGLYEAFKNGEYDEAKGRFINGLEPVILLDFNVYGEIIDEFTFFARR